MKYIDFDFNKFSYKLGWIFIIFSIMLFINSIMMDFLNINTTVLIRGSIEYIVYGVIIVGISKIIDLLEKHYMEMKYFRKHYIEEVQKKEG